MEKIRNLYPNGNAINYNTYLKDLHINDTRKLHNENFKLHSKLNYNEDNLIRNNSYIFKGNVYSQPFIYKKLIVFDYDDTILPTSWITIKMKLTLYDIIPVHLKQLFNKLSNVVINTLSLCLTQGKLVIVTNASLEWLINSAKKFIPEVWSFITQNNIRIISARDRLINSLIDPKDWKKIIFHQIINEVLSPYLYNTSFICFIYSVGDGNDERNACFFISQLNQYSSCIFKSLKFLSEPTCQKLIAEHELFYYFFNSTNNNASCSNNIVNNNILSKNCNSVKNT
ncbi:HAD domain ookinete protein, putative [Plasmodium gallinaceum]|uniref:HAD domain ookinete protein, putative n=1 Tax=Plasmodium gallinaceum TaxID=5849 RepID=A0A1J1GUN5_PLAGA|nr:HAD domain ookinete protein, putative [Plasmodium gallinaceum]CRG95955.1 HAD domain ookinete protein, putative [Plasmodium gallinaceum]